MAVSFVTFNVGKKLGDSRSGRLINVNASFNYSRDDYLCLRRDAMAESFGVPFCSKISVDIGSGAKSPEFLYFLFDRIRK